MPGSKFKTDFSSVKIESPIPGKRKRKKKKENGNIPNGLQTYGP